MAQLPPEGTVGVAVGGRLGVPAPLRHSCAALFVVFGTAWLIVNGVYGQTIFAAFSQKAADFLALSDYGARFLFGNLADGRHYFVGPDSAWPGFGFQFAFKVLPTIIFFGGFMAVLYHWGIMQKVVESVSHFMRWTIGTSGAETLSCSANIFVGQTEAPLLIRPYLSKISRPEMLIVITGGFATVAGSVMAVFATILANVDPSILGHIIVASIISVPAAILMAQVMMPEDKGVSPTPVEAADDHRVATALGASPRGCAIRPEGRVHGVRHQPCSGLTGVRSQYATGLG